MVRHRLAFAALLSGLLTAHAAVAGVNFVGTELTSVSPKPSYMVSGDLNSDGRADIVVISPNSKEINTFLAANTPSNFAPARVERVGDTLRGVALGDLNRDNRLDVVVADQAAKGVWVLLGRGDGTYLEPYLVLVPQSRNPVSVAVANWDQLGGPDLAVADRRDNKVFILLNDNGTPPRFRRGGDFVPGVGPEDIRAADMNRDGKPDIVTLNLGGPRVKDIAVVLFKGVQQNFPEFDTPLQYTAGENPTDLIVTDFTNDGSPDLATLNRPSGVGSSELDVYVSQVNGALLPPVSIPVPCPFFTNGQPCKGLTMTAGDYDTNGQIDIAVTLTDPRSRGSSNNLADAMQIFGGRGDGAFVPGPVFTIGKAPQSMTTGDISGDGKVDISIATQRNLSLQAYVNVSSPGAIQNGDQCLVGDECLSSRCTNGVCCAAQCEPNEICNVPGREGICIPQSTGLEECEDPTDCTIEGSFCVDNVCCDESCETGSCTEPGFEGICLPLLEDGEPCEAASECGSRFCSPNGRCCREACTDGFCSDTGVCSPRSSLGDACEIDEECASGVCDTFDLICCDRTCRNDEFCNPDGRCTIEGATATPVMSGTPSNGTPTPTPTRTQRSTPAPTGELCSVGSDCNTGFCVDQVCCAVSACSSSQHCAEGSGMCVSGGTPTPTRTPTKVPTVSNNPCSPNPCGSLKCIVNDLGRPVCVASSSSSGCQTGSGDPASGNLLIAAMLPLALWAARRRTLARTPVRAQRR